MTKTPIGRKLGQKVKKGKLKASSRRWLERHINDPYVQRAKLEGYRARAAFPSPELPRARLQLGDFAWLAGGIVLVAAGLSPLALFATLLLR